MNSISILRTQLRPALLLLLAFILITGLAYPGLVTVLAQTFFPFQANGSLVEKDGKLVGSALIGQNFDRPEYFWGRISATAPFPYNAAASAGSNLGPTNPTLEEIVSQRIIALRQMDPSNQAALPVDLVTSSASGLDPHISVAAARYQAPRVARVRGLSLEQVINLVDKNTDSRQVGFLGEPRVNVLSLNLALDAIK
jgi:K+-transporting ATPase ATPase C chain